MFGLTSDFPDSQTSRTLTLVAKIIQNLANLTEFEGKEPHMEKANDWIKSNRSLMKQFLQDVSVCDNIYMLL